MKHGTAGGYSNHSCRCRPCTKAWRDYWREWVDKNRAKKNKYERERRRKKRYVES